MPPYLFAELDRKRKSVQARGVDVISLGVGDPDTPTPEHIIKAGQVALAKSENHCYPFGSGTALFRQTVAAWYKKRFNVTLDPDKEIHSLIGSKEGIGHLSLGLLNPGDVALVPDPCYPVYKTGAIMADAEPVPVPLLESNGFLPDLKSIPGEALKKAKLLWLNYPSNPTSATASENFFKETVDFARRHNLIVAHDAAYSEIYFDKPPISFLSIEGAKEVGIEFHSCSKTYNMTGWRAGWVCGRADVIAAIGKVKDNYDSGVFAAIQEAAVAALSGPQDCVEKLRQLYRERRNCLVEGLKKSGWKVQAPQATFYVWAHTPNNQSSIKVAERLLEEAGIVCTPGIGLGQHGEGYVRFALTVTKERIQEALSRLSKVKL